MPSCGYNVFARAHVPLHQKQNIKAVMEQHSELPEALCTDEAVCFIADRHKVTPHQLLRHFLAGEASVPLEPNEVEILKGLYGTVGNNSSKSITLNTRKQ